MRSSEELFQVNRTRTSSDFFFEHVENTYRTPAEFEITRGCEILVCESKGFASSRSFLQRGNEEFFSSDYIVTSGSLSEMPDERLSVSLRMCSASASQGIFFVSGDKNNDVDVRLEDMRNQLAAPHIVPGRSDPKTERCSLPTIPSTPNTPAAPSTQH